MENQSIAGIMERARIPAVPEVQEAVQALLACGRENDWSLEDLTDCGKAGINVAFDGIGRDYQAYPQLTNADLTVLHRYRGYEDGGWRQYILLRLSDRLHVALHLSFPEYSDDEADGSLVAVLRAHPDNEAARAFEDEEIRNSAHVELEGLVETLCSHRAHGFERLGTVLAEIGPDKIEETTGLTAALERLGETVAALKGRLAQGVAS